MSLQLTGNTWELKLDSIFDANAIQHLLGTFTNPFVVINITSDDVLPVWQQAGSIGQAIPFEDSFAYGEVKLVTLNDYLLLQFPLLTGTSYQLYYFPLLRLVSAKVKIWEYQGETIDASITQLVTAIENSDNLTVDLSGIQSDIDCLKAIPSPNEKLNLGEKSRGLL